MKHVSMRRGRLILIGGVIVALGLGVVGVRAYRRSQMDRSNVAARDRGRAALAAGDFENALDGLGTYIGHVRDPKEVAADDYLGYAKARRQVVLPNGRHLAEAIAILRKARQIDPTSRPVQDELLSVYFATGLATEALELLDAMLAESPTDVDILRMKCDLLDVMRQYPQALEVARRIHELKPNDIAGPARTLRLLMLSEAPASDIDLWLAAVTTAHPNDARFDLLRAVAFARRQDYQKAKEALDRVVAASESWKDKDPKFLVLLLGELDRVGRYDDAFDVSTHIAAAEDASLQRECVRRLWYADRPADLVARSDAYAVASATGDAEILALRALALAAVERRPDADAIRRDLAARTDDASKAWSTLLAVSAADERGTPEASAEALAQATRAAPTSAILLVAYGDALAALGEVDAAIGAWTRASTRAPSWARPLCRIAAALRRTGRPTPAFAAAREALARAPRSYEAVSEWLRAGADLAPSLDAKQAAALLDVVTRVRKDAPNSSTDLVSVEAELLARTDKSAVEARLRAVLNAPDGASEDLLLRLAQTARAAGVPPEAAFLDLSEKLHGASPRLATARALSKGRDGGPDAALRTFDEMRARPGAAASASEWSVARARLMDAVRHPGAAAAWIELADADPKSLSPQMGVLSCAGSWNDLAAIDRVVERVRAMTGDSGVAWRSARGRRLLADASADKAALAEAASLLGAVVQSAPDNVSARLLLAQAFNRMGNVEKAEEQLRAAVEHAPDDPSPSIELARVALRRGDSEAALRQIDRALASPRLDAADAEGAASLLAARGELGRSLRVLQPLTQEGRLDDKGLVLLAKVQASLGDVDGAIRICERALDRPDRSSLELAAELYVAGGRAADAERTLARLDALGLPRGDAELVRARIVGRWGAPDDAKAAFRRAVAASPERADVWAEFASFAIEHGDVEALDAILDDKSAPSSSPALKFIAENRALYRAAIPDVRLRPVALAATGDTPDRAVLLDAMRIVTEAWPDPAKRDDVGRRLRDFAQSNARALALQLLTAETCAELGQLRPACDVAERAMRSSPQSAAAARTSARLLGESGRRQESIESAKRWKELTAGVDPQPDLFLARAMLQVDRSRDAAATLAPRVADALVQPDKPTNAQVLLAYAVALARSGGQPKASEMIHALAERSPSWRTLPLDARPEWLGDGDTAERWLAACSREVPPADVAARLRMAEAWGSAWERFRSPPLLARAREVLATITSAADAPARAYFVSARLSESEGDRPAASKAYEEAIARDPGQAGARNNLACLLADAGKWEAAVEQGNRLVAEHPRVPEFVDTLAYALRKGRKFDEARKRMEQAVDLDPSNPAWRVGLAEAMVEAGDKAAAAKVLAAVDAMATAGTTIAPELRSRIDGVRNGLR